MTVAGLIERYNQERPNQVEDSTKAEWLEQIERIIVDTIILTHEDAPEDIAEHFDEWDMDTDLLVESPYDDLYMFFMDQKIAFNNNDTKRYNVSATMYNNSMLNYQYKYNREHMGVSKKNHLIKHEDL